MRRIDMKRNKLQCVLGLVLVFVVMPVLLSEAATAPEKKITVLNPLGQEPPIPLVPLAPRLDTLNGKTIYLVDVGFEHTEVFTEETRKIFSETHPEVNWVFKKKIGGTNYFKDDPELWNEIKEKGDGMIMAIGH
jgi:hypothetical protein